jgi:hypothetical protein
LVLTVLANFYSQISKTLSFWMVFILTRPLGATMGCPTTQRLSGLRTRISSQTLPARSIAARKIFPPPHDTAATRAAHRHKKIAGRAGAIQRRCFVAKGTRRVPPAIGPFAGGLNLRGAAFEPLSGGADRSVHVLSQAEIYAVPNEPSLPD